jgi:hypothetical protein
VQEAVNSEIQTRIRTRYPDGKKLRFQSPRPWRPNAAFVNCYDGPQESVGYHSDSLTYLGPRAVIGSLSLGVAREFRVRRVVPKDKDMDKNMNSEKDKNTYKHVDIDKHTDKHADINTKKEKEKEKEIQKDEWGYTDTFTRNRRQGGEKDKIKASSAEDGDLEGQIAIHLPHNSLLVMHAEMQEEWKHSIAPTMAIDPHHIAGNKRINITYRDYKEEFHPRHTPRCNCRVPTVLRVVQRKKANWGRYFWMCHAGNVPGKDGCSFFQWADFDDDGVPILDNRASVAQEGHRIGSNETTMDK